jgi:hypothetical protein
MILMIFEIVRRLVLRCALAFAIVVNHQIAGQPHQPVLQVTLFWIVLRKGSIDSDKNFLGQVFSRVRAGSEAIGKIVNATAIRLDNLFPGRAVTRATPSD